jgi:hypothetical protein
MLSDWTADRRRVAVETLIGGGKNVMHITFFEG